jgi:cyclohexanone monooxygenase
MMVSGFPNMFVIPGIRTQGTSTVNFSDTLREYAVHLAHVVQKTCEAQAKAFNVSEAAESAWVKAIIDNRLADDEAMASCTPGWTNNEGRPDLRPKGNTNFGPGPLRFFAILENWRSSGMPGLELTG